MRPVRRGAALLVVLAILVVVVTACAALARFAATSALAHRTHARAMRASDLLHAAEAPITRWLERDSHKAVLPPDARVPAIAVLSDAWIAGEQEQSLTITAFDQMGMVPLAHARGGSPLRHALPAEAAVAALLESASPGLDQAERESPVFPVAIDAVPMSFGGAPSIQCESAPSSPSVALGALLATHNPPDLGRRRAGSINVNTAPLPLLEAAMRRAGQGGLDRIVAARERGQPAPVPAAAGRSRQTDLELVGVSTVWSFRIDARVGPLRRSWWSVYVRTPAGWNCVQRLEIAE